MPLYTPVKVEVAPGQSDRLKSDFGKNKKYVSVKLHLHNNVAPSHTMLLTRAQIAAIRKTCAMGQRRFKTIRMSRAQVEKNRSYSGGFLSFLAGLARRALPALAKGALQGILSGASERRRRQRAAVMDYICLNVDIASKSIQ